MFYNSVLVSAIHQHESTIGIHMSLPLERASPIAQLVKNLPAMQETLVKLQSGRSTGERIGYSLKYSWASLLAQLVKNLPAMQETWV